MKRLLALLFAPLLLAAAPAGPPARIVSLNLCADQFLLALADRGQIKALGRFAHDPEMSAAADAARGLPVSRGSAEDVLALRPDLVVAGPMWTADLRSLLKSRGIPLIELPPAETYGEILRQVRLVANAVGHPARGEALIASMNAGMAAIPADAGRGATAAYYQRRGFLTGTGTLVDELLRRVGLRNLAMRLHKPSLARIGLEDMARARPDWLIVETSTDRPEDEGTQMLHHPLLADIPRLKLPQAWTVCGGPAYVDAARSLAEQLSRGPDGRGR